MIVCSCNIIKHHEIEDAILELLHDNPWRLVTPGLVYRSLAKHGKCCGCFPGVLDVIVEVTEGFHNRRKTPCEDFLHYMEQLKTAHRSSEEARSLKLVRSA